MDGYLVWSAAPPWWAYVGGRSSAHPRGPPPPPSPPQPPFHRPRAQTQRRERTGAGGVGGQRPVQRPAPPTMGCSTGRQPPTSRPRGRTPAHGGGEKGGTAAHRARGRKEGGKRTSRGGAGGGGKARVPLRGTGCAGRKGKSRGRPKRSSPPRPPPVPSLLSQPRAAAWDEGGMTVGSVSPPAPPPSPLGGGAAPVSPAPRFPAARPTGTRPAGRGPAAPMVPPPVGRGCLPPPPSNPPLPTLAHWRRRHRQHRHGWCRGCRGGGHSRCPPRRRATPGGQASQASRRAELQDRKSVV